MIDTPLEIQRVPGILKRINITPLPILKDLLEQSASRHTKLCPRQVLGVRMGLYGAHLLKMKVVSKQKKMYVIVEMNGCFADGIEVATGCSVGGRTLHVENLGKVAATFLNLQTGMALRVSVKDNVRWRAFDYVENPVDKYDAQLQGYKVMPYDTLFTIQQVKPKQRIIDLMGEANKRVVCAQCGEEVMNGKEIEFDGQVLCKSCYGDSYYEEVYC